MKEREEEEFEEFIPFCFKAFADNIGESLKVRMSVKIKFIRNVYKLIFLFLSQESTISIEHFRFIMQSLPKGDDMTRKGTENFI